MSISNSFAGETTRASVASNGTQGNSYSFASEFSGLSADGRYVVFPSEASNLVAGDNNGSADIFVHDRQTHQTTQASVNFAGVQGNWYSDDPSLTRLQQAGDLTRTGRERPRSVLSLRRY